MSSSDTYDPGEWWPRLPFAEWRETYEALHMWTQVVGKVKLGMNPLVNHWWHVPLYVSARGLTTSAMHYGDRVFQIDFDFIEHKLFVSESDNRTLSVDLTGARTVADFYAEVKSRLDELRIWTNIWTTPECSPVHFFWGSFDLAVTRFSGRRAPEHPGTPGVADSITREAYSHEVSSAGFWPGGLALPEPIFYSYAYPEPAGFKDSKVGPERAYYHKDFKEFVLPYEAVRTSENPHGDLLQFLQDTYEAATTHGNWDRAALER
jgi:hypothetical protein